MPYNADTDPLIQRARGRSPGGRNWLLIIIVLLVAGWAADRFGLLPFGPRGSAEDFSKPTLVSRAPNSEGDHLDGPFKISGMPGREYYYGMSACVKGKGNAALESSTGLSMCFGADFEIVTDSIDPDKEIEIHLTFGDIDLEGNFFGWPIDLRRRNGDTKSYSDPSIVPVATAANQRFTPPDELVFDSPIYLVVAPDGVIQEVRHDGGFGVVFMSFVRLALADFPEANLHFGDTWKSEYTLSVPGFPMPISILSTSTLVQEDTYMGRHCVLIEQVIEPGSQTSSSATGKIANRLTGGDAPRIVPNGVVSTYFDLDYGKMVYAELNVNFDLHMGKSLKAASDLLGLYSGLLDELEGGKSTEIVLGNSDEMPGLNLTATISMK